MLYESGPFKYIYLVSFQGFQTPGNVFPQLQSSLSFGTSSNLYGRLNQKVQKRRHRIRRELNDLTVICNSDTRKLK